MSLKGVKQAACSWNTPQLQVQARWQTAASSLSCSRTCAAAFPHTRPAQLSVTCSRSTLWIKHAYSVGCIQPGILQAHSSASTASLPSDPDKESGNLECILHRAGRDSRTLQALQVSGEVSKELKV